MKTVLKRSGGNRNLIECGYIFLSSLNCKVQALQNFNESSMRTQEIMSKNMFMGIPLAYNLFFNFLNNFPNKQQIIFNYLRLESIIFHLKQKIFLHKIRN